ncbi:mandelate racemase [Natrarchaeobius chitinivorans]|uniref:Mandelate racemase n=2 Tax=Natrarchaeobius chitinivorans TaxID=1679083 RepID=A0A3N6P8F9_NATCH|nr:mandelate racemase [Natrarchaeobius chitinivorans]
MDDPIGSHLIVKLETDDGLVGWGETPPTPTWGGAHMKYYGETARTANDMIEDYFASIVEGQSPLDIGPIHDEMDSVAKGHPYAKAAIDIALHDLAGKRVDEPVHDLLGGSYRDRIPVAHSLGIMDNDRAVAEAEQAVEEGVETIKVKAGLDAERDVDLIRRLRETLGPDIAIRVDANEGYELPSEAARITRQMEEYDIAYMEQPVDDTRQMAKVAENVEKPIMADEGAWTPQDILDLDRHDAAEIFSLYVTKPGGLHRAKEVGVVAEAVGMRCDIGGSIEMGVGNAANLHLGAAVPIAGMASVSPVNVRAEDYDDQVAGIYYEDDIVAESFTLEGPDVLVPEGPGLGVEVDEEKLEQYSIDQH